MGKVLDNQCPCCGAVLHYNASLLKFKCEYCNNEFTIKDLKKIQDTTLQESYKEDENDVNYVEYHCSNCGAEIIADEQTAATFCLYCGNTAILKNKLLGEFKPNKIIPFAKDKEEAVKAFMGLSKGRPFMPKSFNSKKNIEKITGLYVPFWLFNVNTGGSVNAVGTRVTHWSAGNTHYTKTSYYDLIRKGTMQFRQIPVDGSTRFDDDLMNSLEPFYFNRLEEYNHAYLSGFLAEKYDVVEDDAYKFAEKRAIESAENIMVNSMVNFDTKRVTERTISSNKASTEYVLLPVWMVNVKYGDKYYTFAMNGQTGEIVGDIPLNKTKVVLWSIGLFLIIFSFIILASLIIYYMEGAV